MTKNATTAGIIVFQCRCGWERQGEPDDTLMREKFLETSESNQKHEVFIENSPDDDAGKKILKYCHKCGLNFMTMVRIGVNETTMYSCSCGYRATIEQYMATVK